MASSRSRCLLVAFLLASAGPALAGTGTPKQRVPPRHLSAEEIVAVPRNGTRLLLHAGTYDPTVESLDFGSVGLGKAAGQGYGIVQFHAGKVTEGRSALERQGVVFFGYLPENAFQVRLTPEAKALIAKSPAVRWVGELEAGMKISSRLWPGSPDRAPEVTVHLFPDAQADAPALAAGASQRDAVETASEVRKGGRRSVRLSVPYSRRDELVTWAATLPGVAWIEPYVEPRLHNNDALGPVQSNATTVLSSGSCTTCTIFNHNLTGTGQIATVADSGNDSDHAAFRKGASLSDITDADTPVPPALGILYPAKKLIGYWVQPGATAYDNNAVCSTSANSFHGTHTSGTVVGDNFSTPSTPTFAGINTGDGMAPNAQLLFQDIGNDTSGCLAGGDSYLMFLQALNGGARIHSNSYGSSTGGSYTASDQRVDEFLFDHEEMAIFFSAGNDGPGVNSIGSPGNAKNIVTVGALGHGNSTTVASFSSRGPTDDGRLKPDIQAPGSSTISAAGDASHTSNNSGTKSLSGTSMSCPTVAGASVLLRQYFADGFYPTGVASGANALSVGAPLVKAVLLNGTLPLFPSGLTFPNSTYGWGRIFLDSNLFFTGDARGLRVWNVANTQGLVTADTRTFTVTVGAGQEFRATLVWSDPEGTLGAATTLVNNLNLTVSDGTSTYLGNVFNAAGDSITGGSADAVNNVEQVRLSAPAAGTYTITVSAPSVPGNGRSYTNRQGFALAVSTAACATGVASAPTGLTLSSNATMGVDLSFTSAGGSTVTQIYRAPGTCAAAAADFQYIGSSTGTTFTDSRAQGGVAYAYKVRGADGCGEGPISSCQTITPSGRCDLVPDFNGLETVTAQGSTCRITLGWTATTSACPTGAPVRYNIYRSTAPGFIVGGAPLASVTGVSSYDDDAVTSGVTYYYAVRAEDSTTGAAGPHGGNEDNNSVVLFGTAQGPPGTLGTYTDDAGDTAARLTPQLPWRVTSSQAQAGVRSYHHGPDAGTYSSDVCASLTTAPLSLGASAVLSYYVRYNLEYQWDGVVVEISTNGGASWSDLPPTTPAGYPDTLLQTGNPPVNACGYAASHGAFTGPNGNFALTAWTQYQTSLAAYNGQTVQIRWRVTTDPGSEFEGLYLDTIAITNVNLPGACTNPGCPTITVSPASLPAGTANAAYPATSITAAGGAGAITYSLTAGSLPVGMSLTSGGVLSGTPIQTGSFPITVTATDVNLCTGAKSYTLVIACPVVTISPGTVPGGTAGVTYATATLNAAGGVPPYTYSIFSGALPAGLFLSGTDILGTPTATGTFPVTVKATDVNGCAGTQGYSIVVACPTISVAPASAANGTVGTTYTQTFTQTGGLGTITFSKTGTLPSGLTLSTAGVLSGTPTASGTFNFSIVATDQNGCTGSTSYSVTIACPTITVTPGTIPAGTTGVAYSQQFSQTGGQGAVTFSVTGTLPTGVTLSAAGLLSGTPLQTGSFPITVKATDSNSCFGTVAVTLTIACGTIAVSPTSLPGGTAGVAYSQTLSGTGGAGTVTYGVTSGSLPAGLTLSAAGVLSGTPTVVGSFPFTVTASDAAGCTGNRTYTLLVTCPTITVDPVTLPAAVAGTAYSQTLTATGVSGSVTYGVTSGALPAGLTLTSGGVLSGTPTAVGSFPFTITAQAVAGCTGSRTYTLVVSCPTITVNPAALASATAGTAYNQTLTVTGASGSVTYGVTSGALPAGLTLTSGGVLSGTPTAVGSFTFTVTAVGQAGCTGSRSYTLGVSCPSITVNPSAIPAGVTGNPYTQTFTQTGGVGATTFGLTGTLPAGMSFVSPVLSGTPSQSGVFNVTVTATDAAGCTGSRSYTLNITLGNTAPTIAGGAGSAARGGSFPVTLGTVGDAESPVGSLVVTVPSSPAGITVGSIVNTAGTVTATVTVDCGVALGTTPIGLQVSDGSLTATGSFALTVGLNVTAPVVTLPSPASLTVNQTTCASGVGTTLASLTTKFPTQAAALQALINGGSAADDCPGTPTRLTPRLGGVDVTGSTLFPVGTSLVQLRFSDADGNVGTGNVNVTVRRQGTVNGDDVVDVTDIIIVMNYIVGNLTPGVAPFVADKSVADADSNGNVDVFDVVLTAGYIVGNVSCLTP